MAVPALVIGTAFTVASSIQQGNAAKKAANANAAIAGQDAQLSAEAAAFEARQLKRRTEKLLSAQRAAAGASGLALPGSSIQLVMEETAYEGELEIQHVLKRGGIASNRFNIQAGAYSAQGSAAQIGGFLGAGAAIFGGIAAGGGFG